MRNGYSARYGGLGVVAALLAAAARGAESMGQAISIARQGFDDFASAASMLRAMPIRQGHRRGRGVRKLPRGRPGWVAPYNTEADAARAVRRFHRAARKDRLNICGHIISNYRRAVAQYPTLAQQPE